MKDRKKLKGIILIAAAVVTLVGLLTGWYLFLFLWLPLGWFFGSKKDQNE
tara:strand:+ start:1337 stop:1486 length:150 start_codon:yes stop_codon:yes gene_type:complete